MATAAIPAPFSNATLDEQWEQRSIHAENDGLTKIHEPIDLPAPEATADALRLKVGVKIVARLFGMMALGALLISTIALQPSLVLLGFCVALSMMLFIGLPLTLASISDAIGEDADE